MSCSKKLENRLDEDLRRIEIAVVSGITMVFTDTNRNRDAKYVKGISVSTGIYKGTARVVMDISEVHRIKQGDVLVAPTTTAAFNIVFPLLGAIVTDQGGMLSHPAITAREFNIPGISSCLDATKRIKDGDLVRVDALQGIVEVL